MLGDTREILHELHTAPEWSDTVVGVASCTDEPEWALECMDLFEVGPPGSGVHMAEVMDELEIVKGNKQGHMRRIADRTAIDFEDMLFFDNERQNCLDVAGLGCTVAWVPEGVTGAAWEQSLERFPEPGGILDFRMANW